MFFMSASRTRFGLVNVAVGWMGLPSQRLDVMVEVELLLPNEL